MKYRKLFGLLLTSLLLIIVILSGTFAKDSTTEMNVKTRVFHFSVPPIQIIIEKIKNNKRFEDSYAGVYIDKDGSINVNVVSNLDEIKKIIGSDNVKISSRYEYL